MLQYRLALALAFAIGSVSAGGASREPVEVSNPVSSQADITMFVLPDCGYCERARAHLRSRGLQWKELDISSSAAIEQRFVALGGQGTPLIIIGKQRIHGFQQARIDAALVER